jgi:hypothetical protein
MKCFDYARSTRPAAYNCLSNSEDRNNHNITVDTSRKRDWSNSFPHRYERKIIEFIKTFQICGLRCVIFVLWVNDENAKLAIKSVADWQLRHQSVQRPGSPIIGKSAAKFNIRHLWRSFRKWPEVTFPVESLTNDKVWCIVTQSEVLMYL